MCYLSSKEPEFTEMSDLHKVTYLGGFGPRLSLTPNSTASTSGLLALEVGMKEQWDAQGASERRWGAPRTGGLVLGPWAKLVHLLCPPLVGVLLSIWSPFLDHFREGRGGLLHLATERLSSARTRLAGLHRVPLGRSPTCTPWRALGSVIQGEAFCAIWHREEGPKRWQSPCNCSSPAPP